MSLRLVAPEEIEIRKKESPAFKRPGPVIGAMSQDSIEE